MYNLFREIFKFREDKTNNIFREILRNAFVKPRNLNFSRNKLYSASSKFWGVSGSENRGGGDNNIQFINIGRVGDKSFKQLRRKIGQWKGE